MAAPDYNPVRFQSQFASAKNKQIQSPPPVAAPTKTVNFADLK